MIKELLSELFSASEIEKGDIFIVGCSTSEISGHKIGTAGSLETAETLFSEIYEQAKKHGIYLAVQCCEHLNRAVVIERAAAEKYGFAPVNVRPVINAGGAFATVAYEKFENPVVLEDIKATAKAGLDIGGTLIGMHIRPVAVPLRLSVKKIGEAPVSCAKSRMKYIGGERAKYI